MNTASNRPAKLREYELKDKGKLIVTKRLQQQINFHHKKVGALEWCGLLFFRITEGDFMHPGDLVIEADDFFLMDIGSAAHTARTLTEDDIIAMYEKIPGAEDGKKYGLIHTHHNMTTFFSPTDQDELQENVHNHNYYLSLIVNFDGKYSAKVVLKGKIKSTLECLDHNEQPMTAPSEQEVMIMINLTVEGQEEEVPDYITERFSDLQEEKKRVVITPSTVYSHGRWNDGYYDDWYGHYEGDQRAPGSSVGGKIPGSLEKKSTIVTAASHPPSTHERGRDSWLGRWNTNLGYRVEGPDKSNETKGNDKKAVEEESKNDEGKLVMMKESVAKEKICDWLAACIDLVSQRTTTRATHFTTVPEALNFYEQIFVAEKSKATPQEFKYFLAESQRVLHNTTTLYSPKVVVSAYSNILSKWVDTYKMAEALLDITLAHEAYERELSFQHHGESI